MNVVILSGGSGNDALVRGLKSFYPSCNIKVIINAYDNGKSTGVCRLLTDTLGVSDVRKNHIRMYKATHDVVDSRIIEFYENRYDFHSMAEVLNKLHDWNLSQFETPVINFFSNKLTNNFEFKDFNVANIVYSQMYKEFGYEYTNSLFCDLLGIDDFVILNSFDNVYLHAITASGNLLTDEGEIVEYCNPNDPIVRISYHTETSEVKLDPTLNPAVVRELERADLIVISTGTFWSSIYPTLDYASLYKFVNLSSAKKIWVMNSAEDKDSYGVSSNQFIKYFVNLGLDLSSFVILENEDAIDSLKEPNSDYDVIYAAMGNINGKHDATLCGYNILKIYYNLINLSGYDKIIFDFDDTLWARNADKDGSLLRYSIENIQLLNNYFSSNAIIVSGNYYSSIYSKLTQLYGGSLSNFHIPIWADSNSIKYENNVVTDVLENCIIDSRTVHKLESFLLTTFGIAVQSNDNYYTTCLKIKPLSKLERQLLSYILNEYYFPFVDKNCIALQTGTSTIDIVHLNNNKSEILKYIDASEFSILLYVGDEIDRGNDYEIANKCTFYIQVKDVMETNVVLKLLTYGI